MTSSSMAFWDRVARRYAQMAMRNPDAYEDTLRLIRAHLTPEDRVLEVGCGTGTTALRLAGEVTAYVASDYSSEMIAIAQEKAADAEIPGLALRVGQFGDGSLPEGPFDAVLGFNLLHLLPDRDAAFAEIHQALRPGGLFISKTPCLGGLYQLLAPVLLVLRRLGKAPSFHFLSPARLEREIRSAGFEILETGSYPKRPPSRFIVARRP